MKEPYGYYYYIECRDSKKMSEKPLLLQTMLGGWGRAMCGSKRQEQTEHGRCPPPTLASREPLSLL